MGLEWCRARASWTHDSRGVATLVECSPSTRDPAVAARAVVDWASKRLGAPWWSPERLSRELIGGRFMVYKYYVGPASSPRFEARVVEDTHSGRLVWAGQLLPGSRREARDPHAPGWEPMLPPAGVAEPPPSPRGQKWIRRPVIYAAEGVPEPGDSRLRLGYYSLEGQEIVAEVDVSELDGLTLEADFNCVTGWSVSRVAWRGVRLLDLLRDHGLKGRWLLARSWGGYTTIFPLDGPWADRAILATGTPSGPLTLDQGWPSRLVVPPLYGWKYAKWLHSLLVGDEYLDGYWEARGYHWRGLVALEERFKILHEPGDTGKTMVH